MQAGREGQNLQRPQLAVELELVGPIVDHVEKQRCDGRERADHEPVPALADNRGQAVSHPAEDVLRP